MPSKTIFLLKLQDIVCAREDAEQKSTRDNQIGLILLQKKTALILLLVRICVTKILTASSSGIMATVIANFSILVRKLIGMRLG